jgi:hypothetical protein
MMIPDNDGVVLRHLVCNYGQLHMTNICVVALTFIGQETQKAQNDVQFY